MTARFFLNSLPVATHKLKNYLRMYRKRTGLSQDEIAYLLTCLSGAKVSRYEHFNREPSLETALAYEVIFQVPVRELFGGVFERVEHTTLKRLYLLEEKLRSSDPVHPRQQRRRAFVEAWLQTRLFSNDHE